MAAFQKTSRLLDDLTATCLEIVDTASVRSKGAVSDENPLNLIAMLRSSFEHRMNDDLDVRGAVDSVFEGLRRLVLLKRDDRLSAEDCLKVAEEMRRIDKVLQVLHRI